MQVIVMLACFMSFLATPILAGEIWGIVRHNKFPQKNLTVQIDCNGKPLEPARTDKYGLYSVLATEHGRCQLKIYNREREVIHNTTISSFAKPVRCDVHLILQP
jgi:hypothetical protein